MKKKNPWVLLLRNIIGILAICTLLLGSAKYGVEYIVKCELAFWKWEIREISLLVKEMVPGEIREQVRIEIKEQKRLDR